MKNATSVLVVFSFLIPIFVYAASPPIARRELKVSEIHGDRREDYYYWLRNKTSPEVVQYLSAENAYADAVMKPTEALQKTLYSEMLARLPEADASVPYRKGGFFYYVRWEPGKQYPLHCRRKDGPEGREEILLDMNELAAGHSFFQLGQYQVSDDGNFLAYTVDTVGFRVYTLQLKDLRTGRVLPDRAERVNSVIWAADNRTLFYVVEDESAKRPYRLYRHELGVGEDALLFEETDERFRTGLERTRSGGYLLAKSESETTTEIRYLRSGEPRAEWRVLYPRRDGHRYFVEHRNDEFFIQTNDRGRNYRLVRVPVASPQPESWREVVPHRPEVMLERAHLFAEHAVLVERENGLSQLTVFHLEKGSFERVSFPETAYIATEGANLEFHTRAFRYLYESLVTPDSVYEYDIDTRSSKLLKRDEIKGYDPARYASERLFATASDGTSIPISLVYKKGLARDGRAPLLLEGYGAYGISNDPDFDSRRLSLLDRGFYFAVAHIRGGGEMGKRWHDEGKLRNKINTFTDFIASAEYLISQGFTSKERLAIEGGSAGGLLMGAVTNLRPDLFRVVLSRVPFVDAVNTMLDATLPLTTEEYEEWGNPNVREDYFYIKSYCPYTNLEAKVYPTILVKTGFNDSQVMYWEPAKYVAKLRSLKTDNNLLLFKTNMSAGHGGASGRYQALQERSFDLAFLITQLGVQNGRQ